MTVTDKGNVRIMGTFTEFRKAGNWYPASLFDTFEHKHIFYIVRPPNCIHGFKLGSSTNGKQRLLSYQHIYGRGFLIKEIIQFQRRGSRETGTDAALFFENKVKSRLRSLGLIMPGRGTEFVARLHDIQEAVAYVRSTFEKQHAAQVGVRKSSSRVLKKFQETYHIPVPGDEVEWVWEFEKNGRRELHTATVLKKIKGTKDGYSARFSDGPRNIYLPFDLYRPSPDGPGEWRYKVAKNTPR